MPMHKHLSGPHTPLPYTTARQVHLDTTRPGYPNPNPNPNQVHLDITRPGAPPTQPELVRLTGQERAVNAFLTEAARRLTLV